MKFLTLVVFALAVVASEALLEALVSYKLFLKSSPKTALEIDNDNVTEIVDKNAKEIVLFIHGWQDSSKIDWYEDLKNAYFSRSDDYCIIYVDYALIAALPYKDAVALSGEVASIIKELIIKIAGNSTDEDKILSKINVVGHSLGAQIGGFIGKQIYNDLKKKIGKITGLDPAGPLFLGVIDALNLVKTDAELVLVIHTDGGVNGFLAPCGTIDVYPNGGTAIQPGCLDILNNKDLINCSHKRSYRFFVEAISIKGSLIATKCENYIKFTTGKCSNNTKIDIGADLTVEEAGVYYLTTNSKSPYGKGQDD